MNPHRHVRTPLEARFGTLNGLMHALALAGLAGQDHLMNKMLVLLRREVLRLVSPIGAPDLSRLADAMTDLEHEAGRFAARPSIFNGHVSTAIDVLARSSNVGAGAPQASSTSAGAHRRPEQGLHWADVGAAPPPTPSPVTIPTRAHTI